MNKLFLFFLEVSDLSCDIKSTHQNQDVERSIGVLLAMLLVLIYFFSVNILQEVLSVRAGQGRAVFPDLVGK